MPKSVISDIEKGKQLLEALGKVQYLRLDSLTNRVGEHMVDYKLGSAMLALTEPDDDGYSALEKMAIQRGYKHVVEAYHRKRDI